MKINLNLLSRDDMRKVFGGNSLEDDGLEPGWCSGACRTKFDCSGKCECVADPVGNGYSCRS